MRKDRARPVATSKRYVGSACVRVQSLPPRRGADCFHPAQTAYCALTDTGKVKMVLTMELLLTATVVPYIVLSSVFPAQHRDKEGTSHTQHNIAQVAQEAEAVVTGLLSSYFTCVR